MSVHTWLGHVPPVISWELSRSHEASVRVRSWDMGPIPLVFWVGPSHLPSILHLTEMFGNMWLRFFVRSSIISPYFGTDPSFGSIAHASVLPPHRLRSGTPGLGIWSPSFDLSNVMPHVCHVPCSRSCFLVLSFVPHIVLFGAFPRAKNRALDRQLLGLCQCIHNWFTCFFPTRPGGQENGIFMACMSPNGRLTGLQSQLSNILRTCGFHR